MARILMAKGQRGVDVTLEPASRQCAIELAGTGKGDVRLRLMWWIEPSGDWIGQKPIVDTYHEDVARLPLRRIIPAGAAVFVIIDAAERLSGRLSGELSGRLYWPRTSFVPLENSRIVLHEDAAWTPTIRIDAPVSDGAGPPALAFLPDYSFAPPGPPIRVDAWKWRVTVPGWGRRPRPKDGDKLSILPPVPILALVSIDGTTVARRFKPGDGVVDLRRGKRKSEESGHYRRLSAVPQVDRKPAPPGSFVLPGRLDVATIGSLIASRSQFPGMVVALPADRRGVLPADADLVPADWLTVWHPRFGLSHMRWPRAGIPGGKWYPGSMVIRAPKGWLLDGSVVAFPIWRGTGRVQTTPPVAPLRRKFRNVSEVRFGGLRPGWHSFVMRLDLVQPDSARRHPVTSTRTVRVHAEKLRHYFRLYSPDR